MKKWLIVHQLIVCAYAAPAPAPATPPPAPQVTSSSVYYKWCKDWLPVLSKKCDKIQGKVPTEPDPTDVDALCRLAASMPFPNKEKYYTLTDGNKVAKLLDVLNYISPLLKQALDEVCSPKAPKTKPAFFFLMSYSSPAGTE